MEHKVEDLLASIKKAMDGHQGKEATSLSGESRGTLMRGALREMRVSLDQREQTQSARDMEMAELRERILRNAAEVPPMPASLPRRLPVETPPKPARNDFRKIMETPRNRAHLALPPAPPPRHLPDPAGDLRPGYDPDEYDDVSYNQPPNNDPYAGQFAEQAYETPSSPRYQPEPQRPVRALVSPATEAMTSAAFEHLSAQMIGRLGGDRYLEDTTRELLRGMLKGWLDENLPRLVEDLVREEIERVARRGR